MPIVECTQENGNPGWKVQNGNKCFATRKEAEQQLKAIHVSKQKRSKSSLFEKVVEILKAKVEGK